jgi:hypothetical protein
MEPNVKSPLLLATIFVALCALPIIAPGFFKSLALKAHDALFAHLARSGLVLGVNAFSKEEIVAFEQMCEGFDDSLVLSRAVSKFTTNSTDMERAADTIWRPYPYIALSYDGMDQTANFLDQTQLSVPATLGFSKSSPWVMDAKELRDALQENRLGDAARQKLASDVNIAVNNVAALQGTLVVKRTSAASGFDDFAQAEAIMNEQGIPGFERYAALSTRDYNGAASNLQAASRSFGNAKSDRAYEKAYVGQVASFDTYKMDYCPRLAAAAGVTVTINDAVAANRRYVPRATSTAGSGERNNVDNRYMNLTIGVVSGLVKIGDSFTIAGVNAVHHITKQDTGQLKTFRITGIVSGGGGAGVIQISPPIIVADGATVAEKAYANVTTTPANGAAITFLNTAAGYQNPFWQKDAIELLPGRYAVPADAGTSVMRATTPQGIELVFQKWYDIKLMKTLFRLDELFGVCMKNPEMAGIMLFSQP